MWEMTSRLYHNARFFVKSNWEYFSPGDRPQNHWYVFFLQPVASGGVGNYIFTNRTAAGPAGPFPGIRIFQWRVDL